MKTFLHGLHVLSAFLGFLAFVSFVLALIPLALGGFEFLAKAWHLCLIPLCFGVLLSPLVLCAAGVIGTDEDREAIRNYHPPGHE